MTSENPDIVQPILGVNRIEYTITSAKTIEHLVVNTNLLINEGWFPHGEHVFLTSSSLLTQQMRRLVPAITEEGDSVHVPKAHL